MSDTLEDFFEPRPAAHFVAGEAVVRIELGMRYHQASLERHGDTFESLVVDPVVVDARDVCTAGVAGRAAERTFIHLNEPPEKDEWVSDEDARNAGFLLTGMELTAGPLRHLTASAQHPFVDFNQSLGYALDILERRWADVECLAEFLQARPEGLTCEECVRSRTCTPLRRG